MKQRLRKMWRLNFVFVSILLMLICTNIFGQTSNTIFKNFQEAQKQSVIDVQSGEIRYFTSGGSYDKKSELVYHKRDSILREQYGIRVIPNDNTDLQYTQMCYNRGVIDYFDSVYRRNIFLDALVEGEKEIKKLKDQ